MSVHYKFKSALEYDTVTFDGLHISVRDLKKSILHQKRIGKNTDFDLQITNAQTKQVYTDDGVLIPKNTSLIVARIPLTAQQKKAWDRAESNQQLAGLAKGADVSIDGQDPSAHRLAKVVDLSSLDASEEDKIQAMMTQSTQDYNPVNYMKIRGAGQMGEVPTSYRCYKCHQTGHWIKNCPLGLTQEPIEIKKSTGIPRSFMVPVEGPGVPGAMMTPTGQFAVPAIDHQAYKEGKKERPPFQQEPEPVVEKPEIPEDLVCNVCKDLLTDAVMIPCCGNSFCDECIRTVLLESEDHECPDCKEKDVSPDTLIPNRFLRNNVNNFKNETGYNKSSMRQPRHPPPCHGQPVQVIGAPPVQQIPPESVRPPHDYVDIPGGDMQGAKVEVITSTGVSVRPQRMHQSAPSTIPVLGASSHRAQSSPQPLGPPVPILADGGPPMHIQDRPPLRPPPPHLHLVPQPPGVSGPPGPPGVMMPPGHELPPPTQAPGLHAVHPAGPRRSVEERPGTPTIDEHNQDVQAPNLPDTSVPPPNFPPGEEPTFAPGVSAPGSQTQSQGQAPPQPIETLGVRFQQHRMPGPHSFRGEHPFGPIRNFAPRGSHFEHGPPSYHHESGSVPGPRPPHFADDRDSHRGSYRGFQRGRGRMSHGGYRGSHLHHQPPPPGLSRGSMHNGNQAGTIDDPLEAFERMLREKDERDHKLRRGRRSRSPRSYSPRSRTRSSSSRSYTRSRSRSRTRSRSRSRTRTPRSRTPRSRTPRKRSRTRTRTRSRSRSFTISRSRSRSFSRSPTPRPHSPRVRDYSPRRRVSPRYRTPPRSPPRFSRQFKDVRQEFEPPTYYEPPEFQYPRGGGRGRGGRFGQRKDYGGGGGKDYYDENYSGNRYGSGDRFGMPPAGGRDMHHRPIEPILPPPHPPGVPPPAFRRFEHYDVAPPGTGPDIPGIGSSYDKPPRYDRGYDNRQPPLEDFLTPPGVEHRFNRDRDRDRDIGPPGVRDRDIGPPNLRDRDRDRDRDIGPPGVRDRDLGPPMWDNKDRDTERERDRDRDRDRDRGGRGDYYEAEHRRYGSYNSPDVKKRKQSLSPGPGRHERYSSGERHHRRGGDRRKNLSVPQGGKENRHVSQQQQQQPVETVVDAAGGQRDREKETQKRERVLVDLRKEPSVERQKKEEKEKVKDKKKKKKEKEPEGEKLKKKKRKEKKENKKEGQEGQDKTKSVERKVHHKEKEEVVGEEKKAEEKPVAVTVAVPAVPVAPDGLYGDMEDTRIDDAVVASYGKVVEDPPAPTEEVVKLEPVAEPVVAPPPQDKAVMLAPMPEPSKWELDDEYSSFDKDDSGTSQADKAAGKVVTSEVLKRAENAIFQKAINAIRPIEPPPKKTPSDKPEKDMREARKTVNSIQITIPIAGHVERSVEMTEPAPKSKGKLDRSKFTSSQWTENPDNTSPHRVPAKERLGARVDGDDRKKEETKRHRSRSDSRERKHKKGLKSAVEKKHAISRSRSRSHGRSRYDVSSRYKRYIDMERERRPLDRRSETRKWEEAQREKKSPEHRRERSDSHDKPRPKLKEEPEKPKAKHKLKKKTKRRSESRTRKKSVSDRETKRSKKKDKKHKKEKGKKHKQREEKTEKKEGENEKDKEEEREEQVEAVKEVKAAEADDTKVTEVVNEPVKEKPRKGGRRNPRLASDRKKSTLDEASFEPDYDASSSIDTDVDDAGDDKKVETTGDKKADLPASPVKKRDRSASVDPAVAEQKRQKLDKEVEKPDKAAAEEGSNKKSGKTGKASKKRDKSVSSSDSSDDSSEDDDDDSSSGSSSSSDDDSSDDSSVHRRRKKKSHHKRRGKRSKKASRRASNSSSDSDSESESASSSDSDAGRGRKGSGRSKKHRHRNKSSKKKKKSKHR